MHRHAHLMKTPILQHSDISPGVIKIYTPRKYGHPGSPYSRDLGDPVVIIGTPSAGDWQYGKALTDDSRSMLSTTICATNSTQKEREFPWVLPNEEVTTITSY